MTHDGPPNRRFRRAFYNWDGSEAPWRLNPTSDLRELVAFAKYPFAALSPRHSTQRFQFSQRGKPHFVEAAPLHPDIGLATVADLDIMVVVASYLTWCHDRDGVPYDGTVTFRPATLLDALGKSTGGEQHRNLHAALARLTNTQITTSLSAPGCIEFRLLNAVHTSDTGELMLTIDPWLWREVQAERIAKIDPVALTLRGLERRLYSWARAHLGAQRNDWRLSVPRARAKAASVDALRKFRSRLAAIAARNRLPHFRVTLERDGQNTNLVLSRRVPVTAAPTTIHLPSFDVHTLAAQTETVCVPTTFSEDD